MRGGKEETMKMKKKKRKEKDENDFVLLTHSFRHQIFLPEVSGL